MPTTNEGRSASADANSGEMAMFGPHVVALIDLLGQSSELAKWDFVPNSVTETATWVPAVRNTLGRVLTWRSQFETSFDQFHKSLRTCEDGIAQGTPADVRTELTRFRQTQLHSAHFSDTIMFYSPLQNEHGYWQVSNVAGMIVTCGALLLAALNHKTVFRGAIDVGMLTHFPPDSDGRPGDPYGPALAKAHHLESKVADYPRIVVGQTLLSYLDAKINNPDPDRTAQANRAVALDCRPCITQDTDGCWIVDYMGDMFAHVAGNPDGWQRMKTAALAFVQSELARFRAAGVGKLESRYQRLEAYFRSRGSKGP